jgi:hypothetical protein
MGANKYKVFHQGNTPHDFGKSYGGVTYQSLGVDLNSYRHLGDHVFYNSGGASTANSPFSAGYAYAWTVGAGDNSSRGVQFASNYGTSAKMYWREMGTPSNWRELLTTDANGNCTASANLDDTLTFGRAKIGYVGFGDYAGFAHYDSASTSGYSLLANTSGDTFINCQSGRYIYFREANSTKGYYNGSTDNWYFNDTALSGGGGLSANISNGGHASGGSTYFPGYHNRTYGHQFEAASTGTTLHIARETGNVMQIGADANATVIAFRNTDSASTGVATQVGYISITASSTAYNTSSDYRLKENAVSIVDGITRIKQLSPKRFNFIAEPEKTIDGFFAHEVSDIVPEAINGEKDAMKDEEYEVSPAVYDDEGELVTERVMGTRSVPDYQGIDQSKLIPLLTAALQEAITKIEENAAEIATLKTQVAALTSNSPE